MASLQQQQGGGGNSSGFRAYPNHGFWNSLFCLYSSACNTLLWEGVLLHKLQTCTDCYRVYPDTPAQCNENGKVLFKNCWATIRRNIAPAGRPSGANLPSSGFGRVSRAPPVPRAPSKQPTDVSTYPPNIAQRRSRHGRCWP
eukprot:1473056-Pyramimonas_sp.AAC.2